MKFFPVEIFGRLRGGFFVTRESNHSSWTFEWWQGNSVEHGQRYTLVSLLDKINALNEGNHMLGACFGQVMKDIADYTHMPIKAFDRSLIPFNAKVVLSKEINPLLRLVSLEIDGQNTPLIPTWTVPAVLEGRVVFNNTDEYNMFVFEMLPGATLHVRGQTMEIDFCRFSGKNSLESVQAHNCTFHNVHERHSDFWNQVVVE